MKIVLNFDKRPFSSVDEMDRVMIEQWNAVVRKEDDIYILGDFCYHSSKEPLYYLNKLKGRKHLIQGNHDGVILKDEKTIEKFVFIEKMTYVKDGQYTIVLCHFPLYRMEWR